MGGPTQVLLLLVLFLCCAECARVLKLRDDTRKIFLYSGALKNKKIPHGEGTAWYSTYKGKWANGFLNKKGMITFPGGASFSGKFKIGKPVVGVLTNMKSESKRGRFKSLGQVFSQMFGDCKETKTLPEKVMVGKKNKGLYPIKGGGYFLGKVKKGAPHKKGTAYLVRYEGTWKNGKWDGAGYLYFPGGYVLKGRFDMGEPAFCLLENKNEEQLFAGAMDSFADIHCSTSTTTTTTTVSTPPVPCVNCTTESGGTCQFPFTVSGTTFTSCTAFPYPYFSEFDGRPWCATQVDGAGNALLAQDAWGYCTESCPSDAGYPATGAGPACEARTTGLGWSPSCAEQHNKTHKNILMLGNSYTAYNSLASTLSSLATAAGFSAHVVSDAPGGQTLGGHVSEGLGSITSGDWDVVVIQDQSQRPSFPTGYVYYNIIPEARAIVETIRAKNPCTVPVFFQTWGKRDGDSMNCPTFHEDNWMCTFEGIQGRLTESYSTFAYLNQPAKVAPAGEGFRIYENTAALFAGDGSHPSPEGSYLTACTMLETIWGVSCVGNSYQPVGDSVGLQEAAHTAVSSATWAWPAGGPPCLHCLGLPL